MPPLPPCDRNSRSGSPSRARLSLLTFFGKTKKVSRPRQGTKQRPTTNLKTNKQNTIIQAASATGCLCFR
ncbi:hypothetical protein D7S78_17940 [Ralstonia pickettii]|nr:hypothetical protein [Ralstonia pickettii]MBA9852794.1 hypothetical protein [Ralstonia pickettii]MBA9883795.1 hypothetical protein [Ralstonia pickettii]MBA9888990.1 hypothetical protein [Ralstonia pickettii]MBA9959926.1 hypothetical protein [Ralstonia pickettii]